MTLGEFLFGYGWFSHGYILACLLLWAYAYWRTGGRNGNYGLMRAPWRRFSCRG